MSCKESTLSLSVSVSVCLCLCVCVCVCVRVCVYIYMYERLIMKKKNWHSQVYVMRSRMTGAVCIHRQALLVLSTLKKKSTSLKVFESGHTSAYVSIRQGL